MRESVLSNPSPLLEVMKNQAPQVLPGQQAFALSYGNWHLNKLGAQANDNLKNIDNMDTEMGSMSKDATIPDSF